MPTLADVTGHPIEAWLRASRLNLEHLRLALIGYHRESFESVQALGLDPTAWMARALDANFTALIRAMELYEQAARFAEDVGDLEF
jgi:hypothetical protein